MRIRRTHLAILSSAFLALIGVGIFLGNRPSGTHVDTSQVPPPSGPGLTSLQEPIVELPAPTRSDPGPEVLPPIEPVISKPAPALASPVAPVVLADRYKEIGVLGATAKNSLRKRIEADPELSEVWKAKLVPFYQPLQFIAYAQALEDPLLRPPMLEFLSDHHRLALLVEHVSDTAQKYGIRKPNAPAPKTAEEVASLIKALEPHYQAEYDRLVEKMGIDEEMAQHVVNSQASETLYNPVYGYLLKRGWTYNVKEQKFEPSKPK
jgi:hypothetical protein